MDEKTLQAITALADKLGTTAEYLFGVLLKQAPITGTIDLFVMVILTILTFQWFKFVKKKTTPEGENSYPEWDDECMYFAWLSFCILALVTILMVCCGLQTTVAAFFNPEYWALMQILK